MKAGSSRDVNELSQTGGGLHQAVCSTWHAAAKLQESLTVRAPNWKCCATYMGWGNIPFVRSQEFTERGWNGVLVPWAGWGNPQGIWAGTLRAGRVLRTLTLPWEKGSRKMAAREQHPWSQIFSRMNRVMKGDVKFS